MIHLRQSSYNPNRGLYEFDVVEDSTKQVVGFAQLRTIASKAGDMPAGFESNVYYEISPVYQNKGYATRVLTLLKQEAAKHDLPMLIATVNAENKASITVIEHCAGTLESSATTSTGKEVLKYRLHV